MTDNADDAVDAVYRERYETALRALRGAQSVLAAAVVLYLKGQEPRSTLERCSADASEAETRRDGAERLYRHREARP